MDNYIDFFLEQSKLVEKLELNSGQEKQLRDFLDKFGTAMVGLGTALEQSKDLEAKIRSGEAKSYTLEELQEQLGH